MENKKRKPLTPEQRAKKNAADRARRAAKKLAKPAAPKFTKKPKLPKVKKSKKPALPKGMRPLSERSGKFKRPVKIKQHGITRPTPTDGDGKPRKTFMVWEIADKISAKTRKPATRAAVKKACDALRTPGGKKLISYSTFSNSFYAWRQFNGIRLRLKLDGTLSKPMGPGHGPGKGKKAKRTPAKKTASRKPPLPKPAAKAPVKKAAKNTKKPALPVATQSAPAATITPAPLPPGASDLVHREPAPAAAKPASAKPPLPETPAGSLPFIAPPPV